MGKIGTFKLTPRLPKFNLRKHARHLMAILQIVQPLFNFRLVVLRLDIKLEARHYD